MSILLACSFDADEWAAWLPCLQAALPGETWHRAEHAAALGAAERAAVDIAIVANPRPGQLTGYPGLRLIQSLWAGVDRLLGDASLPAEVTLARMIDPGMTAAMAETALWAVLSLHRGYFSYARQQAAQRWQQLPQRRADEVQVLVAGAGELGLAVSARLLGQGYRVATWGRTARTRTLPPAAAGQAGHWQAAHGPDAWAALARQADVVINLMPLTPGTRGWFDAPRFAGFKPGAGFVNLARGAAVVEADLLAALDAGQLGHAVLDVFAHEPLPDSHAFWTHPRVSVLPHVAALTDPRSAALVAAANVRAVRLASGAVIGTSGGDDEGGPGDHGSPGGQGEQAQPGTSRAPGAVTTGLSGLVDRLRGY